MKRSAEPGAPVHDLRLLLAAAIGWIAVLAALRLPAAGVALLAAVGGLASAVGVWRVLRGGREEVMTRQSRAVVIRRRQALVLVGCVVSCLVVVTGCQRVMREAGPVPAAAQSHRTLECEGVVQSDPRPIAGAAGRTLLLVRVGCTRVTLDNVTSAVSSPVLVFADDSWASVSWHDTVRFRLRLKPAQSAADDVVALGSASGAPLVLARPGLVTRGMERLRSDLRDVTAGLPGDAAGLVPAMVIGDTSRIPPQLSADMRATGMTHLNAVSGSNVVFVMMATTWIAGWLRVRARWRMPFVLLALVLFILLCRPEPSVLRAGVMGAIAGLAMTWSGRRAGPAALGAAIVVLLIVDPWLAGSFGFALSALATAGLIFFARPWGAAIAMRLPSRARPVADAVAIPLAAQAVCGPVIVLLQSSVTVVGVPANLLAAPFVAPATLAGVATVLCAPFGSAAAWLPAHAAALPALVIARIAHAFARVPGGSVPWPPGAPGALLLAALTLAALLSGPWLIERCRRHPGAPAAGAVVVLALLVPVPGVNFVPPQWVYVACDVGQGDGGVINLGGGQAVVIDTGPEPDAMDDCLQRLGVSRIDTVVLTHFHADHVDGLGGVLRGRTVRQILTTPVDAAGGAGSEEEPSREPQVRALAAAAAVPIRTVRTGDVLTWAPDVVAAVLWPARTIAAGSVQNNASVTLDLHAHGLRLLMTGDLEREADAAVLGELRAESQPQFDVLKVAHHGSKNQLPALIDAVRPSVSVISVGVDNDYGHPAPATLDLLRSAGSAVFRTDLGGDVIVSGTAGAVQVRTRR
ncbi:ComEC/Rec2 family competence protein [Branchiibius cervicis]|uniref:ComEC/Rec2 family competence protein n=1 Tax=Branchiibius cervicis TaxID=908252 RepID=A0ABW2AR56_9MICO